MKILRTFLGLGLGIACWAHADHAFAQTCYVNMPVTACSGYNTGGTGTAWVISGGEWNSNAASYSTIGGGYLNSLPSGCDLSTISGGEDNVMYCSGSYGPSHSATIAGGTGNQIWGIPNSSTTSYSNTIAGGRQNTITGVSYSSIGGGYLNSTTGPYSTIAGGYDNSASGYYSAIAGGYNNAASGWSSFATGYGNTSAGATSFAGGYLANADKDYCFVWSDGQVSNLDCSINYGSATTNVFVVGAVHGAQFVTGTDAGGNAHAGVYVGPSGGSWVSMSDRNRKNGFQNVDPQDVLEHVLAMPVTTWRYNGEPSGVTHMGPMAQDFWAAFHLGDDDHGIANIDAEGVAVAAIQGLYREVTRRDETIAAMSARTASLEKANVEADKRVVSLEKRLEAIEAQLGLKK